MENERKPVLDFRKRKFFRTTRKVFDDESKLTRPVELAVYAVLCMHADNIDTTSHPSIETIAKKSRSSERVVHRCLKVLKDAGYIDVINRTDRRGFKTSNQYVLLDVKDEEND